MTIPGQADEIPAQAGEAVVKQDSLRRLDAAYICYAFLGLGMIAIGIVGTFLEGQAQAGYAMLLLPLFPLMLGAFVGTIVLTVKARRQRSLLILCLIHILFLAAIVLVIDRFSAPGAIEWPVDTLVLSYGAVFTLVPIWWLTMGRRRNRDKGTHAPTT